jgi:V/A-type H+-transporting ATPase subunit I
MGAPGPKELSPVPLVAVLFPLYFGWMFGDVGHGLLLALFAVSLYKLGKRDWAWIWGFAAVSVVLFGLYYGEAFGRNSAGRHSLCRVVRIHGVNT